MRQDTIQNYRKAHEHKSHRFDWLIYLPGAAIIAYGFWLSMTV